jgi:hypothetical protein
LLEVILLVVESRMRRRGERLEGTAEEEAVLGREQTIRVHTHNPPFSPLFFSFFFLPFLFFSLLVSAVEWSVFFVSEERLQFLLAPAGKAADASGIWP